MRIQLLVVIKGVREAFNREIKSGILFPRVLRLRACPVPPSGLEKPSNIQVAFNGISPLPLRWGQSLLFFGENSEPLPVHWAVATQYHTKP